MKVNARHSSTLHDCMSADQKLGTEIRTQQELKYPKGETEWFVNT